MDRFEALCAGALAAVAPTVGDPVPPRADTPAEPVQSLSA